MVPELNFSVKVVGTIDPSTPSPPLQVMETVDKLLILNSHAVPLSFTGIFYTNNTMFLSDQ